MEVPPLPHLPPGSPSRFVWQPLLAAAAVVLIALVVPLSFLHDGGSSPQPAPQPTDVVTDDPTDSPPEEVPTGPPTAPYLLKRVVHAGDESFPGYDWVDGTAQGWVAVRPPFVWSWSNGGAPDELGFLSSNRPRRRPTASTSPTSPPRVS